MKRNYNWVKNRGVKFAKKNLMMIVNFNTTKLVYR